MEKFLQTKTDSPVEPEKKQDASATNNNPKLVKNTIPTVERRTKRDKALDSDTETLEITPDDATKP